MAVRFIWPVLIRTLYSGMLSGKKNILLNFLCQIVSYDTNNVMFIDLTIYYLLVLLVSYLLGIAKFVDFHNFVQDSQHKSGCRQDSLEGL